MSVPQSLGISSFRNLEALLTIPTTDLVKVYKEKSLVLDKQVTFEQSGKAYSGIAKEIGDKGNSSFSLMTVRKNGWALVKSALLLGRLIGCTRNSRNNISGPKTT